MTTDTSLLDHSDSALESAQATSGLNRSQFLRNGAKGGIALVAGGTMLGQVTGISFASSGGVSDNSTLQAAYAAESLAVFVYSAIIKNFHSFKHPKLKDLDYFKAALKNEQDHKAFLGKALASKTPTGLQLKIPSSALTSGHALLKTGVALETAFVQTYLGAVETLSSAELKTIAAKVATNEASHLSFIMDQFSGNAVLPSLPATGTVPDAAKALSPFIPNLLPRLEAAGFPHA
ncbi:MAG TPA: ferritin-like domain-containing protein [Solirubrobacteraceae bacterium]|jgi:hypothetical protein